MCSFEHFFLNSFFFLFFFLDHLGMYHFSFIIPIIYLYIYIYICAYLVNDNDLTATSLE